MYKFDFELDDFQKEAVLHINENRSIVVCAPTGAGKTCIAEHAIHLALENNQRIFYTTPLKALSNQKFRDFSKKYGSDKVGLLTGDTSVNRDAQVVIMTTEVFRNMLYGTNFGSISDNLKNVKYVVLDEVHYMNDEQRGTVWEESIIYCPTNIQIIALSATVANVKELSDWINTVHSKTEMIYTDFRPVPLRHYYFSPSHPNEILPIVTPTGQLNKKIQPEPKERNFKKKQNKLTYAKSIINILNQKNMLPAIYFSFSRKKCDEQMEKCQNLCLVNTKERQEIEKIINEYLQENQYLTNNKHLEYLKCGVASHHAGLLPGWKALVEQLFQKGLIKVVFATETLAAGINMPARTTIIGSISKRTDNGHRMLTSNEFLQMSGRAGRRGIDEIGYVVVVGTQFQSPQEVADLVLSPSEPLESKFSPCYSMVINLLQRFSVDEAKELILKSFGYFSSNDKLKKLFELKEQIIENIEASKTFNCFSKNNIEDLMAYNKLRDVYVENKKVLKTVLKQNVKSKKFNPEIEEFRLKVKKMCQDMNNAPCNTCRAYKKHMKQLKLVEREEKRLKDLNRTISKQSDIYWNKFLAHKSVLEKLDYIKNNYPQEKGIVVTMIRAENELYIAEVIQSQLLDNLSPAELASVLCAITTEDLRGDSIYAQLPISVPVKKVLGRLKEIRRKISILQKEQDIETPMYINSYFSPLIEWWVNGATWEEITDQADIGEGDIVRVFKRTIDLLRQITILPNINPDLAKTARAAIDCILREPIDVD